MLADKCLGLLLHAIEEQPSGNETLLIVTSPRGYPLGEHRRVGPCDEPLYGELLQVPLLIQFPGQRHALARLRPLVQPHEIYSVIAETCGWQHDATRKSTLLQELSGERTDALNVAYAASDRQRAIRTPAWFLRESLSDASPRRELFAKPDDHWEANEVSSRCADVMELLAAELDRFEALARGGQVAKNAPLAEVLYDIWR